MASAETMKASSPPEFTQRTEKVEEETLGASITGGTDSVKGEEEGSDETSKLGNTDGAETELNDCTGSFESIVQNLMARMENWHGLNVFKFGELLLHGSLAVGKESDCESNQSLDCFLFSCMLICCREDPSDGSYKLKGSILFKHLIDVSRSNQATNMLEFTLSVEELPEFYISFTSAVQLEQWHKTILQILDKIKNRETLPDVLLPIEAKNVRKKLKPIFTPATKLKRGLKGFINGKEAVAFADTGAGQNAVSAQFAEAMELEVVHSLHFFRLGNEKPAKSLGIVNFSWSFEDEPRKSYKLVCYVLPRCIYDIIIGRAFLIATKTLSNYRTRLAECSFPGLTFLNLGLLGDTHQRIRLEGVLDDQHTVLALPDTGAECNVMEERFAILYNLPIDYSCTNWIRFADCTYQQTMGQVKTHWTFASGTRIPVTFEILRKCSDKVIIGEEILYNHDVFDDHYFSIRTFDGRQNLDFSELAPFNFLSSSEKTVGKFTTKLLGDNVQGEPKLLVSKQALEAENARRKAWNNKTDFGRLSDEEERLREKERRAEFDLQHSRSDSTGKMISDSSAPRPVMPPESNLNRAKPKLQNNFRFASVRAAVCRLRSL